MRCLALNNLLIIRGSYQDIFDVKKEVNTLTSKTKRQSKLYEVKTSKYIKKLIIVEEVEVDYLYNLKLSFQYAKRNVLEFINLFQRFNVEIIHMCENEKNNIWIVNKREYIKKYHLIPQFAIQDVLYEYMNYKESAIVTDQIETIKYDRNTNHIVINEITQTQDQLLELLFKKTIKGKVFYDILEQFINNYYEKCINSYENLYSISKEINTTEEPSPFALFIVTFGLFGLIAILLFFMGYL